MDAMQLRLIVMRHAKAGELPGGPDAERALTERGTAGLGLGRPLAAGQRLRARGGHLLRGPADPADLAAAVGRARAEAQLSSDRDASTRPTADDLLDIIARTPEPVGSLMYIGHNPAAAQLAYDLAGAELRLPDGRHRGHRRCRGRGPTWPRARAT